MKLCERSSPSDRTSDRGSRTFRSSFPREPGEFRGVPQEGKVAQLPSTSLRIEHCWHPVRGRFMLIESSTRGQALVSLAASDPRRIERFRLAGYNACPPAIRPTICISSSATPGSGIGQEKYDPNVTHRKTPELDGEPLSMDRRAFGDREGGVGEDKSAPWRYTLQKQG